MSENETKTDRRAWLCRCARYATLAGITVGSAVLIGRGSPPTCDRQGACGHCPALSECELPQAVSQRSKHPRGGTDG